MIGVTLQGPTVELYITSIMILFVWEAVIFETFFCFMGLLRTLEMVT